MHLSGQIDSVSSRGRESRLMSVTSGDGWREVRRKESSSSSLASARRPSRPDTSLPQPMVNVMVPVPNVNPRIAVSPIVAAEAALEVCPVAHLRWSSWGQTHLTRPPFLRHRRLSHVNRPLARRHCVSKKPDWLPNARQLISTGPASARKGWPSRHRSGETPGSSLSPRPPSQPSVPPRRFSPSVLS